MAVQDLGGTDGRSTEEERITVFLGYLYTMHNRFLYIAHRERNIYCRALCDEVVLEVALVHANRRVTLSTRPTLETEPPNEGADDCTEFEQREALPDTVHRPVREWDECAVVVHERHP